MRRNRYFRSSSVIEHGIPIPDEYEVVDRMAYDRSKYPFEMMEVGDSFVAYGIPFGPMCKKISQWKLHNKDRLWEQELVRDDDGKPYVDKFGRTIMIDKMVHRTFRVSEMWDGDKFVGSRVWCVSKVAMDI